MIYITRRDRYLIAKDNADFIKKHKKVVDKKKNKRKSRFWRFKSEKAMYRMMLSKDWYNPLNDL
jgi:hypothetical protein